MKLIQSLLLFLMLTLSTSLSAQEDAPFIPDRPGALNSPDILPKYRLQLETGAFYEYSRLEEEAIRTWALNISTLHFGISDYAELRLDASWLDMAIDGNHYRGLANLGFGIKAKVVDGYRFLPTIGLMTNVYVPDKREDSLMPDEWGGLVGLLFQNPLTSWLSLGYEADLLWQDNSKPTFFWGIGLTAQATKRLGFIVDQFNYKFPGVTECKLAVAVTWLLARRIQIDAYTDFDLKYPKDYIQVGVGLSWQITK